jgi:stringent starvation protein B
MSYQVTPKTSIAAHLIAAYVQWYDENGAKPYISFNGKHVDAPFLQQFIQNGVLILNASSIATSNTFMVDHNFVQMASRFSGKEVSIKIPTHAVLAVYSPDIQHTGINLASIKATEPKKPTPPATGVGMEHETPKKDNKVVNFTPRKPK